MEYYIGRIKKIIFILKIKKITENNRGRNRKKVPTGNRGRRRKEKKLNFKYSNNIQGDS